MATRVHAVIALSLTILSTTLASAQSLRVVDPHAGPALTPFEKHDLWGFLDARGRVAIAPTYDYVQPFDAKGGAMVLDASGWSCIDTHQRTLLVPFIFDNGPDYVAEGLARFESGGRIGYFETGCVVRIAATFDFGLPFSEGRAAVCRGCVRVPDGEHFTVEGGKWGYVDARGREVIPLRFDAAESFEGGVAEVTLGGKTLQVSRSGDIIPRPASSPSK